jgi:hypothetical protein
MRGIFREATIRADAPSVCAKQIFSRLNNLELSFYSSRRSQALTEARADGAGIPVQKRLERED